MTGETVEMKRRPLTVLACCLVAATLLAAAGLAMPHVSFARLALLPAAAGSALLLTRRRRFALRVEDGGLELLSPRRAFIPYDRMEALCLYDSSRSIRSFAFAVLHQDGALLVPAELNVRSGELFEFLRQRIPDRPRFQMPPALRRFFGEQRDLFGDERVFTYRAIPRVPTPHGWFGVVFSLMLLAVGVAWAILGAKTEHSVWAAVGRLTIFVSLVWLVVSVVGRFKARHERGSADGVGGLVIAPVGIGLQQGGLRGRMQWDEITQMSLQPGRGIRIHFPGGHVTIRDLFDAPPREIYGQLKEYWRGPAYSGRD